MKDAVNYLRDNGLNISTGLIFTCRDYDFIIENNFDKITINEGRLNREEILTKKDIIQRILDLYFLITLKDDFSNVNLEDVKNLLLEIEKTNTERI